MPKYKMMISETCSGFITIEAVSEAEAMEKAQDIVDGDGVDGFADFNCTHRDADVLDAELIDGVAS